MTQLLLDELITSLATVLIRYHDSQKTDTYIVQKSDLITVKKESRAHAFNLLKTNDFDEKLKNILDNINTERTGFFHFINDEIITLKKLPQQNIPFTELELVKYKNKITALLHDFKQLLVTPKTLTYDVSIIQLNEQTPTTLSLNGMIDSNRVTNVFGVFKSTSLCTSGNLIKEELLERLNLSEQSEYSEIEMVAKHICTEHQNALIATKYLELMETMATMKETHSQETIKLNAKIQQAQDTLDDANQKLHDMQSQRKTSLNNEHCAPMSIDKEVDTCNLPSNLYLNNTVLQCHPMFSQFRFLTQHKKKENESHSQNIESSNSKQTLNL